MNYREAVEEAQRMNAELLCTDPRLQRNTVLIRHFEGFLLQDNAFVEVHHGQYLYFFAEHAPPQVFPLDEIKSWAQFQMNYPPREIDEEDEE